MNTSTPSQEVKYSRRGHPIVKFERLRFEYALEIVALIGLIYGLYQMAVSYPSLPDQLPSHYGASGKPDDTGPKSLLFLLAGVSLAIYVTFTLLVRFPWHFNYPWKITEKNAAAQYRIASALLTTLKTIIVWMITWIIIGTINIGLGTAANLPEAGLYAFLALTALTVIFYFVFAFRAR